MANNSIYAAFNGLHEVEGKMDRVSESLHSAKSIMATITSEMDSMWEGHAKNHYQDRTTKLGEKMEHFAEEMEKRRQQLTDSIAVYERVESENTDFVEDLSVGDLF